MDPNQALLLYRNATAPYRKLDDAIASVLGWSPRFEIKQDLATGKMIRYPKAVWLTPSGNEEMRVPDYSKNAQAAREFLDAVAPGVPCAVVMKADGRGEAQLWEGDVCEAPNVSMAMCIAGLTHLIKSMPSK